MFYFPLFLLFSPIYNIFKTFAKQRHIITQYFSSQVSSIFFYYININIHFQAFVKLIICDFNSYNQIILCCFISCSSRFRLLFFFSSVVIFKLIFIFNLFMSVMLLSGRLFLLSFTIFGAKITFALSIVRHITTFL